MLSAIRGHHFGEPGKGLVSRGLHQSLATIVREDVLLGEGIMLKGVNRVLHLGGTIATQTADEHKKKPEREAPGGSVPADPKILSGEDFCKVHIHSSSAFQSYSRIYCVKQSFH